MNRQVLFEVSSQSMNTSFCEGCGSYIPSDQMQTACRDTGQLVICCRACKRSLYRSRIEEGVKWLRESRKS